MADATHTKERRKRERKRPLGLVYVELASANGGMLRDLSESGFAMRTMIPLRPGESTPFSFSLDHETRLAGECKVAWVEEDGRVAGLVFTSIPRELPGIVRDWLRENSFAVAPSAIQTKPPVKEVSTLQELRDELRSITPQARPGERTGTMADPGQGKKEAPVEPLPVLKKQEVAPPVNHAPVAAVKNEPIEPVHNQDVAPLPDLEPLPGFAGREAVPGAFIRKQEYAGYGIGLAIRMMIALALLASGVVYHRPLGNAIIWLGQKIAGSDAPEISYKPGTEESLPAQVTVPGPAQPSPNPPAAGPEATFQGTAAVGTTDTATPLPQKNAAVPPVLESTSQQPRKNSPPVPATTPAPVAATNHTTTHSGSSTPAPDLAGQQEYLSAREILKNKNSGANLPEAVRLLWVAVEKGNSNAEVSLAELYRSGEGVTRSCDQTRILLTAAAKKGNADAQKLLDRFLKEGCE